MRWLVSKRRKLLRERYRVDFLKELPAHARVLDVGCGNNSPGLFKQARPDLYYVGLDVGDYNQHSSAEADEYVLTSAEGFASRIAQFPPHFDAVVSAHNIEHCLDPDLTLEAMLSVIKPGGRLFMSFPSEKSVSFPSRRGTLNFYDDPTHLTLPNFRKIVTTIADRGFSITFQSAGYRPLYQLAFGLLYEPMSRLKKQNMRGTWALYGFEAIIWAQKPA